MWLQCWNWKFEPSGAERRGGVDPDAGRPTAARAEQRQVEASTSLDAEPGQPSVEDGNGVVLDHAGGPGVAEAARLHHVDDGILQIVRDGPDVAGDDQDRKVADSSQVREPLLATSSRVSPGSTPELHRLP